MLVKIGSLYVPWEGPAFLAVFYCIFPNVWLQSRLQSFVPTIIQHGIMLLANFIKYRCEEVPSIFGIWVGMRSVVSSSTLLCMPSGKSGAVTCIYTLFTLKRKCCHFDEILITDCTESCHFDNFRCSQWWKFRQNDHIFVSVSRYGVSVIPIASWSLLWHLSH